MAIRILLLNDSGRSERIDLDPPADGTSPIALHAAVLPIHRQWLDCSKAIVDANANPDAAMRALGVLWSIRIKPTVLLLEDGKEGSLLREFEKHRGLFYRWKAKPESLGSEGAEPDRSRSVVLGLVGGSVSADIQNQWSQTAWGRLVATTGHESQNLLAGMRFLRGAVAQGYLQEDDYTKAAILLGAGTTLVSFVPPGAKSSAPGPGASAAKVLFVEDEPYWEALIRPVLRRDGIDLDTRTTVHQTLNLLEQRHSEYSALILDLHFPLEPDLVPQRVVQDVSKVAQKLPIVVFSSELDARVFRDISPLVFAHLFKVDEAVGEADPVAYVERFRTTVLAAVRARSTEV
jgi:CheY-like chemotaxis protein